jgi:hypothetical protein
MFFIFCLIIIAATAFFYKIYIQMKIKNPTKQSSIFSIIFRFYSITDLLPLKRNVGQPEEQKLRAKANISLLVFYVCFIAIQLISFFG